MRKSTTVILQAVIVLVGLATLAFLLVEPHFEGVNAGATWFRIYFQDPFLAYAYAGSVPFFVALHRAFKALGDIRHNDAFTASTTRALRTVRQCALITAAVIVGGAAFLLLSPSDDRPPIIMLGTLGVGVSLVAAAVAARLERLAQGLST